MTFQRHHQDPPEKYVFIERLMSDHGFAIITSVIGLCTLFVTSFIRLHSERIQQYRDNFCVGVVIFALLEILLLYAMRRNFWLEKKELLQSERALRLSEERMNLALNGMSDGLWDWNIATQEIYYSPRFMALTGHTAYELPYAIETFTTLVHPDDLSRVHDAIRRHFKDRSPYRIEYRLKHKYGHYVWCEARGQAQWNEHGSATRMTGFTMDVSEHKLAEQHLLEARTDAERATKLKSEFLANMSHELRTPMNGVIGMSQLLLSGNLNPNDHSYAETILQSAENLLYLLNDILDLSKIEAGKIELEHIPFDLYTLCDDVCDIMTPKTGEKQLELLLHYSTDTKRYVYGDPGRVRQILLNLITNAIKFTDEGSIEIHFTSKIIDNTYVQFTCEVRDSGIGIPADKQDYIFNKFSQADETTTRKFGGTGLGLAICKDLTHMMGGEIGVKSTLGEGSTFWFTMVLEKNYSGRLQTAAMNQTRSITTQYNLSESRHPHNKKMEKNASLKNVRILLAEDNPVNQRVAVKMLEKYGCEVVAVNNGQEALSTLEKDRAFDLVLMDCQMPVMDGYEATDMIRTMETTGHLPHMPVIAFTANALKGDDQKCYDAGMDDYITKPINPAALEKILMEWISYAKRIDCVHEKVATEAPPAITLAHDITLDEKIFNRFSTMVGDEIVPLLASHRESLKEYLHMLRISLDAGSFLEVSRAAHTIKSSNSNLGASKTVYLARQIETLARSISPDIDRLRELAQQLEIESQKAEREINKKMASG